ncbi:MAG: Na+/H+ antiporter NhaC family protein [Clostridium sp.]
MEAKTKKAFKMPHTFVIIISIILFATLMTWIIPAGEYVRMENANGIKVIDPTQFSFIGRTPVNPLLIPLFIVKAIISRIDLMLVILFSGGAFDLISKSGALHSAVAKVAKLFQNKLYIFIPIMTTIFALICTTQGVNQFIAFAPVIVMITLAMGLDSITGAAIILLGGAVGFSTGTLNPSTTIVAQEIAELPIYSGLGYRAVCFVVFLVITNIYLVRYATKIKKTPSYSPMFDLDSHNEQKDLDIDSFGAMDVRKSLILTLLVGALVAIVWGCIKYDWDMAEIAAMFIGLGVAVGFVSGETPSSMSKVFIDGCKKMLTAALIIGLATAIGNVMKAGHIVDTVVYGLSTLLSYTPRILLAPAMYVMNTLTNFVIVSGSGQAAAVMPIMIPVSDLVGVTRQTSVLAFNFGDGFCNYILPHSTALMGIISAVNIPYDRWMKFMWKMFLIWAATACVMISIAQAMSYGPM